MSPLMTWARAATTSKRWLRVALSARRFFAPLLKQHARAQVRGAFDFAYQQLAAPCDEGESLLSRLIRCSLATSATVSLQALQQGC